MPTQQIIAFYRGRQQGWRKPASWFLAWWQKSDFSHCETILRRVADRYECASATFADGVRVRILPLDPAEWEAYEVPASVEYARAWVNIHEDDLYDWRALLGFIVRRIRGRSRSWFCSEASAAMAGFSDPWRFDVAALRTVCQRFGKQVPL